MPRQRTLSACWQCGALFYVRPCQRDRIHYCSPACRVAAGAHLRPFRRRVMQLSGSNAEDAPERRFPVRSLADAQRLVETQLAAGGRDAGVLEILRDALAGVAASMGQSGQERGA